MRESKTLSTNCIIYIIYIRYVVKEKKSLLRELYLSLLFKLDFFFRGYSLSPKCYVYYVIGAMHNDFALRITLRIVRQKVMHSDFDYVSSNLKPEKMEC